MFMQDTRYIACYCRVSTDRQADEGYSLDAQQEKIRGYLKLFDEEINNIVWLIDDGYSAKSMNRPKMNILLNDIKSNKVKSVYIVKLDRLSRSVTDTYEFMKLLVEHDCSLVAIMDKLDISTANGRMFVGILAIVAQWERETISERVIASHNEIIRRNLYPYPNEPFGYDLDRSTKTLSINQEEAYFIRRVYALSLELKNLHDVVAQINDECILGKYWKYKHVSFIMNNPIIRGHLINNRITLMNHHECIITEEEYKLYKESINRISERTDRKHPYIFRGLCYCATCGSKIKQSYTIKKDGRTYTYYTCKKCHISLNEPTMEWIIMYRLSIDYAETINKKHICLLNEKYSSLEKKERDLINTIHFKGMSLEMLNAMYEQIQKEKEECKRNLSKYMNISFTEYSKLSNEQKELLYKSLYKRIDVNMFERTVVNIM